MAKNTAVGIESRGWFSRSVSHISSFFEERYREVAPDGSSSKGDSRMKHEKDFVTMSDSGMTPRISKNISSLKKSQSSSCPRITPSLLTPPQENKGLEKKLDVLAQKGKVKYFTKEEYKNFL